MLKKPIPIYIFIILIVIFLILGILAYNYLKDELEMTKKEVSKLKSEGYVKLETLPDLVEKIKPSIVCIIAETNLKEIPLTGGEYLEMDNKVWSSGTGFIYSEDGYIITANHVIENNTGNIIVSVQENGKSKDYKAKVLNFNEDADIAIIKIEVSGLNFLELGDYNEVKEGEEVAFIGFPLIFRFPITHTGIISAKTKSKYKEDKESVDVYTINAFVNQGNSGGPLFSVKSGKVIGIINARFNQIPEKLFLKLPENYEPIMRIGGVDPISLSVETYNRNLRYTGEVNQVGIGFSTSINYAKSLLGDISP